MVGVGEIGVVDDERVLVVFVAPGVRPVIGAGDDDGVGATGIEDGELVVELAGVVLNTHARPGSGEIVSHSIGIGDAELIPHTSDVHTGLEALDGAVAQDIIGPEEMGEVQRVGHAVEQLPHGKGGEISR